MRFNLAVKEKIRAEKCNNHTKKHWQIEKLSYINKQKRNAHEYNYCQYHKCHFEKFKVRNGNMQACLTKLFGNQFILSLSPCILALIFVALFIHFVKKRLNVSLIKRGIYIFIIRFYNVFTDCFHSAKIFILLASLFAHN